MADNTPSPSSTGPVIVTVPGLFSSGPGHWQTIWEQTRPDTVRADLGQWDQPHRNSWVNQLGLAVRSAGGVKGEGEAARPVVLAAHSLGCIAVAWWALLEPDAARLVQGALLVAPPEVDFFPRDPRVGSFAPVPVSPLPFPTTVVASRNDPWVGLHAARRMAKGWAARFVDLGEAGHINADSGLGDWPVGQSLLAELIGGGQPPSDGRTAQHGTSPIDSAPQTDLSPQL